MIIASAQPGGDPTRDLAFGQGHALTQRLIVVDRTAGTTSDRTTPRSYARLRPNLARPTVPVSVVATDGGTSITTLDRFHRDQLTWYSTHQTDLCPSGRKPRCDHTR
jgi:hypothetical protein